MTQVLPSSAYPLRRELRTMVYAAITREQSLRRSAFARRIRAKLLDAAHGTNAGDGTPTRANADRAPQDGNGRAQNDGAATPMSSTASTSGVPDRIALPDAADRARRQLPKPSLPVRLALLVAGTTLPLIIFATVLVFNDYEQDRKDATQRVLETVRSIRLVLDAEMQRMTGGLQVLALTNSLRNGEFDDFRPIASGFLDQYGKDGIILVADRDGRQLFSSLTSDTASLPLRNNRDIVERVFITKHPQYSNLFVGAVKQRWIVTVEVPVIRDGEVLYDISFSPPIEMFQAIIEKQRPGEDWTISMFDREGIIFARVPNPQDTIGKRASPSLYAEMFRQSEATLPTVSLEGVSLMSSFARSPLTGWTVAAGIAENSLVAPLWRNLAITSVIGGACCCSVSPLRSGWRPRSPAARCCTIS